ncbi:MAG: RNA polymerase sigma factor [Solirubrobacteraceae bacterium]|nr:RNA polymerase sigma factor [Solirubrobacteraceae bacterium]
MASPGPSDAVLLSDRLDPAESFSTFYRRHARGMVTYCASQGLSAQDAADLTSEIFIAALTGRYRFDPSLGESATPWLYAIATNLLSGRHRKNNRERAAYERIGQDPVALTDRDLAEFAELRDDVERALGHIADLPESQRAAVVSRHLKHSEYLEIAQSQGVTEQVARQRVSRALLRIRSRMNREDGLDEQGNPLIDEPLLREGEA